MSTRPAPAVVALIPAVAFVGSAAVTVLGALQTSSATATLNAALVSGTGTAADVYGSQSAIVVSSGLVTSGLVGLVVSLAVFGVLIGFGAFAKPVAEPALDEFEDFDDFDDEVEADTAEKTADAQAGKTADASAETVAEASDAAAEAEPARA